jgi:tetratricopeptide (TPR) repeat protein
MVCERGLVRQDPVSVGSWGFQLLFVRSQRCPCGGSFDCLGSTVHDGPLECHTAQCDGCHRVRDFWFDIALFHDDPRAHTRFEELRVLFEEALENIGKNDLQAAKPRFEEVAAREPWFGVAWFHLGMIALVEGSFGRARRCLENAVGILPLDAGVHQSLAELWMQIGDEERAARAAWMAMTLESTLDASNSEG